MIPFFCNLANQTFTNDERTVTNRRHVLTQSDSQPLRVYLLTPARSPASGYPFFFDTRSGDPAVTCIVSLRDLRAEPINIGSTPPLDPILHGFGGVFNLNTEPISDFLEGVPEREAAFCVDIVLDGNKISLFRAPITLRAVGIVAAG